MGENEDKMRRQGDLLLKRLETNIKGVALDIHANLVEDTPVDTGWARSNWVAQLRDFFKGVVGSPKSIDPATGISSAKKIAGWKSGQGPIFISNNVPYIGRLNNGSSDQAPAGFVEKAIQRAVNALRRK